MTAILIFAKAPQPGFAKTRLIPLLGAEGAAQLALRMLQYTVDISLAAAIGSVELCVTPDIHDPVWQKINLPGYLNMSTLNISTQGDGDLGARLARAMRRLLQQHASVLVIGTDCLQLTATHLAKAVQVLTVQDAVIHPTHDGGYALLGLSRFDAHIFNNIAWSTDTVAATTLQRLHDLAWQVQINETLQDVDEPNDMKWVPVDFL